MQEQLSRLENLIGNEKLNILKNSRVAVFGIGGVGGYALEALARSGVGTIDIIDSDNVDISNLNRQIISLNSNIGQPKVEAAEKRVKDINPEIVVNKYPLFFDAATVEKFDFETYDYVIDAIDTVTSKIELILTAQKYNVPIISSMGTGNKLEAYRLEVSDIYKTSVCPLARVMRYELKKRGVKKLKVVYSKEEPIKPQTVDTNAGKHIPASAVFVPACAGMILAGEVVNDLIKKGNKDA